MNRVAIHVDKISNFLYALSIALHFICTCTLNCSQDREIHVHMWRRSMECTFWSTGRPRSAISISRYSSSSVHVEYDSEVNY